MTEHATESLIVRQLTAQEVRERTATLSDILIDCVEGGASVSFMAPLTRARADAFWRGVADGVAAGDRVLLVAEDRATGEAVGTVQIVFAWPENQPHRADVAKMLVRRSARRRGVGGLLMRAAEEAARVAGKTLLVLDTVSCPTGERPRRRMLPGAPWPYAVSERARPAARRARLRIARSTVRTNNTASTSATTATVSAMYGWW